MASTINASNSGFGGIVSTGDSSGQLQLQTANTTAVTIDTSQNVGIGTTSPDTKLSVYVSGGTSQFRVGNNTNYYWDISRDNASTGALTFKNYNADTLTERMRITSTGNVGIGDTGPATKVAVSGPMYVAATNFKGVLSVNATDSQAAGNGAGITLGGVYTGTSQTAFAQIAGIKENSTDANYAGALSMYFRPNGDTLREGMRINSSGSVLVGNTNDSISSGGIILRPSGEAFCGIATGSNAWHVWSTSASVYRFYVSAAGQISATSTSITALSDESLKENIKDIDTGLEQIMQLKPRRFDWKEETQIGEKNVAGFIAQEVADVLPELVYDYQYNETETKKALKMGDMVPTLVKAIQEQQTIINDLKARIETLEGAKIG